MKNCRKVQKYLSKYALGDVSRRSNRMISEHLEICSACQTELQKLKKIDQILSETPTFEPPTGMWNEINQHIRNKNHGKMVAAQWFSLLLRPLSFRWVQVGSLVVILVLAIGIYHRSDEVAVHEDITPEFFIHQHYALSLSDPLADHIYILSKLAEEENK